MSVRAYLAGGARKINPVNNPVPGLAAGTTAPGRAGVAGGWGRVGAQKLRRVASPAALPIAGDGFRDRPAVERGRFGEVFEKQLGQARERDAIGAADPAIEPFAERHERGERRCVLVAPEQGSGLNEISAVANQVPITRKTAHRLHLSETDEARLQNFVRRVGIVSHLPLRIVADDGRSPETLEDSHLDFMRVQSDESVKAPAETLDGFAGQTDNEIGVDVHTGFAAEKTKVIIQLSHVLTAADEVTNLVVEGLDADFELKRGRWKLGNDLAQLFGQSIRDHLEVQEQAGAIAFQEKVQERFTDVEIQVERAIDKFELGHAAVEQSLEMPQQFVERRLPDRDVER
jgi:hypothetical protein